MHGRYHTCRMWRTLAECKGGHRCDDWCWLMGGRRYAEGITQEVDEWRPGAGVHDMDSEGVVQRWLSEGHREHTWVCIQWQKRSMGITYMCDLGKP